MPKQTQIMRTVDAKPPGAGAGLGRGPEPPQCSHAPDATTAVPRTSLGFVGGTTSSCSVACTCATAHTTYVVNPHPRYTSTETWIMCPDTCLGTVVVSGHSCPSD